MNLKVFEASTDICWWEGVAGEGQIGGREHEGLQQAQRHCRAKLPCHQVSRAAAHPHKQRADDDVEHQNLFVLGRW